MKSILTGLPSSREVFCIAARTNTPLVVRRYWRVCGFLFPMKCTPLFFGQKSGDQYPFSVTNESWDLRWIALKQKQSCLISIVLIEENQSNKVLKQDKIMNLLDSIANDLLQKICVELQTWGISYNLKFWAVSGSNFKNGKTTSFLYFASQYYIEASG
jgi:hypothetical protein